MTVKLEYSGNKGLIQKNQSAQAAITNFVAGDVESSFGLHLYQEEVELTFSTVNKIAGVLSQKLPVNASVITVAATVSDDVATATGKVNLLAWSNEAEVGDTLTLNDAAYIGAQALLGSAATGEIPNNVNIDTTTDGFTQANPSVGLQILSGVKASGTITVATNADIVVGTTTIAITNTVGDTVTFSFVAAEADPPVETQIVKGANAAATATDIATKISNHSTLNVSATSDAGVVTVTQNVEGEEGNAANGVGDITLVNNNNNNNELTRVDFAGGINSNKYLYVVNTGNNAAATVKGKLVVSVLYYGQGEPTAI